MTIDKFKEIVKWLGKVIKGSRFENNVYVVGGAVRDFCMGLNIKDIDLVITNIPDGGLLFAEWMEKNGHTKGSVVTYPTYGTAMFKPSEFPEVELECVMTRGEQYHDKNSRNPETYFGTMEDDAFRRDLTINALYMKVENGEILDPTGKGLEDMENHLIRITNTNPDIVLTDDPLRSLRVCRFASRFGWKIEKETYKALIRNADRLEIISKERIQDEFVKILLSKNPVMGMELLQDTGLLIQFIPEFGGLFDMKQNIYHDFCTVWEHTLKVVQHASVMYEDDLEKKKLLMLGAVLHDIGKLTTMTMRDGKVHFYNHEFESERMSREILRNLKFPNDVIDEVCFIVKNHMCFKGAGDNTPKDKSIRKFQYECKTKERFELAVKLMHADNLSHGKKYCLPNQGIKILNRSNELVESGEDMFGYKLPIDGNDIMEYKGIGPGRDIKKYQEYLLKMAFNNVKTLDREACFKYIKNIDVSRI